jgi:hypothetical protein
LHDSGEIAPRERDRLPCEVFDKLNQNQSRAFALAEGPLHAFQIVETGSRRDNRDMTPSWLVRLNDFLAWLNPVLGLVAGVLAAMVIAAAAEHLPVEPFKPMAPAAQTVHQPAAVACPQATLPSEWRELSRYD